MVEKELRGPRRRTLALEVPTRWVEGEAPKQVNQLGPRSLWYRFCVLFGEVTTLELVRPMGSHSTVQLLISYKDWASEALTDRCLIFMNSSIPDDCHPVICVPGDGYSLREYFCSGASREKKGEPKSSPAVVAPVAGGASTPKAPTHSSPRLQGGFLLRRCGRGEVSGALRPAPDTFAITKVQMDFGTLAEAALSCAQLRSTCEKQRMADEAKALSRSEIVLCCCLPIIVICTSTALIRSNQYLMQKDHFPYPFFLVILHCIFCSTFAALLLLMRPSLFPALTDPEKKVQLSMRYYVLSILPIALFFAFSLVLSNMAYKYCSVAFLQMIKEGNIICIYVMAVCAGIESYSHTKVAILVVMVAATWSCVEGELNFSFLGFMVQATGGLCEAAKTIFQSLAPWHRS
eukprot:g17085.t1